MTNTKNSLISEETLRQTVSERRISFKDSTKLVGFLRRMPATSLILAPYLLLFLPPAFIFKNPSVWFLIGVALIALCGTALVDLVWPRSRRRELQPALDVGKYDRRLFYLAFFSIAISSGVGFLANLAGKGSVAVQTGRAEISSGFWSTLDSLVGGWSAVGVGLLVAAYFAGQCSRKELLFSVAVGVLGKAGGAIFTQITAPLFSYATFLVMFLIFFGLIRFRTVVIGIIVMLYVWPSIYEVRNQLRVANGVAVSEDVSAFDRIRFDLQFSRAQGIDVPLEVSAPGFLYNPSILDILRFGLIPRFLDPDRDLVSTGRVINIALGGSSSSAFTFGPVTSIYVLQGPIFLFLYYAMLAILINWVWQRGTRLTPVRLMFLATLFSGPLGWFSTHPDVVIGALQTVTSSVPLLIILSIIRKKSNDFVSD